MALDVVDQLVRSNAVDMVVVDSVAALVPRAELEGEMADMQMGLQARLMSKVRGRLNRCAFCREKRQDRHCMLRRGGASFQGL